ncbi:hypothetical protein D2122_23150 [Salmonella enterica subsp. enterica serovar Weslaco]|uniref:Uncharacterized protein n=1 Tax=Salmonella enterica subsp. enterica serovar Weslaco TaxID=1243597 RepID=A0A5X3P7Q2_SALET|nr:hypothetical protein [Salmonella enterica]EBP3404258.1 hypothetical protein [Salmonella enterica subsp. enterica]EBZ5931104.1 hypothetical protein [Salmonella enterica subsp. enterica serovar Weslaco]EAZ0954298.1 hypothetical protein [Salmonella enterica]EBA2365418.1 hypothetical protein [Salmonella enterica]
MCHSFLIVYYWNDTEFLTLPVNIHVISLYLHSSGEDAFDSLADCTNEIAQLLYQNNPDVNIRWTEHPHRRKYLKETTGT